MFKCPFHIHASWCDVVGAGYYNLPADGFKPMAFLADMRESLTNTCTSPFLPANLECVHYAAMICQPSCKAPPRAPPFLFIIVYSTIADHDHPNRDTLNEVLHAITRCGP